MDTSAEHTPDSAGTLRTDSVPVAYVFRGTPNPLGFTSMTAYAVEPGQSDGEKTDWNEPDQPDPFAAAGRPVLFSATAHPDGSLVTWVTELVSTGAPPLWFVSVAERAPGHEHLVSLVAFADGRFADGTVIDESTFALLDVPNESQAGAFQWSRRTGLAAQLFVAPEHRRSKVAYKILFSAGAYHHARRWPGFIHADGRRTALGQRLAVDMPFKQRIAPHSELSPPMDPDE